MAKGINTKQTIKSRPLQQIDNSIFELMQTSV